MKRVTEVYRVQVVLRPSGSVVRVTVETPTLQRVDRRLIRGCRCNRADHDKVIGLEIGLQTVEKDDLEVAGLEYRN